MEFAFFRQNDAYVYAHDFYGQCKPLSIDVVKE